MRVDDTHPNVSTEVVAPAEYATRTVSVEFLYLDREECTRCRDTEDALTEAIDRVAPLLATLDVELRVEHVHVDSERAARLTELSVSPTVRVNGRDVQPDYAVSTCESCGELCDCGETVDCRLWTYRGETHESPPVELFVEALLAGAIDDRGGTAQSAGRHATVPSNLRGFFGSAEGEHPDDDPDCC